MCVFYSFTFILKSASLTQHNRRKEELRRRRESIDKDNSNTVFVQTQNLMRSLVESKRIVIAQSDPSIILFLSYKCMSVFIFKKLVYELKMSNRLLCQFHISQFVFSSSPPLLNLGLHFDPYVLGLSFRKSRQHDSI